MLMPEKATDLRHPELYTMSRLKSYHKQQLGSHKQSHAKRLKEQSCVTLYVGLEADLLPELYLDF